MTWPGWGDVLPLLTTLVTTLVTVIGAVVTWAAREAAAGVSAEVKALAEKLATNDFPPRGDADRSRFGGGPRRSGSHGNPDRIDRMGGRMESMEARILAAVQRRPDMGGPESGP